MIPTPMHGEKLGLTSIDQPKHCSDLLFARKVTDGYSAGGKGTVHPTILAANREGSVVHTVLARLGGGVPETAGCGSQDPPCRKHGEDKGVESQPGGRLVGMQHRWFTWHMNAYRIIVGAIVLAMAACFLHGQLGVQAMWISTRSHAFLSCSALFSSKHACRRMRNWLRD